jgi:hypothetical protein
MSQPPQLVERLPDLLLGDIEMHKRRWVCARPRDP